jgi:uncharacterized protein YndB with AHSA1/START domain
MKRTIHIKRTLPYSIDQVWKALTDAKMLGLWFMPNDFEPVLYREFTFHKDPQPGWDGITNCQVTALNPPHTVAYTYRGTASGVKTLACADIRSDTADAAVKGIFTDLDTVLKFTLTPEGTNTRFVMEHSGFKGFKLVIVSFVMEKGWKKLIREKLPAVLEEIAKK